MSTTTGFNHHSFSLLLTNFDSFLVVVIRKALFKNCYFSSSSQEGDSHGYPSNELPTAGRTIERFRMEIDFEDASGLGDVYWTSERQASGCEGPALWIGGPTPFLVGECVICHVDDELMPALDANWTS